MHREATMDPMALNQDAQAQAQQIFRIVHEFFCGADAHKRNPALESFPQNFPPWRRVYKLPAEPQIGATAAYYQIMEPWQPSELSFGGAGPFWCFTVLPRTGENISRKTDDGQAWLSKSGRGPKKGYPEQIWVDKLVITGKAFHMLELTLKQENKPIVALCKIWRRGNSEAASPQTSLGASASSLHEVLNSPINEGLTAMQIDQPQGQLEGTEQQQMNDCGLSMSGYVLVDPTQGLPDFTEGGIQSTWPDDDSIYQGAVSYLYNEKESFKHVASCSKNDAHKLASDVQSLASTLRNLLNFLGIKKEGENTRPTYASNDNNQIMGTNDNESNPAEPTPDQANSPDQDLVQLTEGHSIDIDDTDQDQMQLTEAWYSISNDDIDCNYFNSDALINHLRDGENGTNFDADNDDLGV